MVRMGGGGQPLEKRRGHSMVKRVRNTSVHLNVVK